MAWMYVYFSTWTDNHLTYNLFSGLIRDQACSLFEYLLRESRTHFRALPQSTSSPKSPFGIVFRTPTASPEAVPKRHFANGFTHEASREAGNSLHYARAKILALPTSSILFTHEEQE